MRFACLGSGSAGNALLIQAGATVLLLDCGFGPRELGARLARIGMDGCSVDAVVVTHEHSDHSAGAFNFARRQGIPVLLSAGTLACMPRSRHELPDTILLQADRPHVLGDILLQPFTVPHDAREPLQFVFRDGARALGVLTDLGRSTAHVEQVLSGCDSLVLECNHDEALLQNGPYPAMLKKRITGGFGHLSNIQAAQLLGRLPYAHMRHVVAAHLSESNNRPELAQAALAQAMGCSEDCIDVADQSSGLGWRDV